MCEEHLLCVSKTLGNRVLNRMYMILALIMKSLLEKIKYSKNRKINIVRSAMKRTESSLSLAEGDRDERCVRGRERGVGHEAHPQSAEPPCILFLIMRA